MIIFLKKGNRCKSMCSMCEKIIYKNNALIPLKCLINYGDKVAHRICKDCWWDADFGFAREGVNHKCPGCIKMLPLTQCKEETPDLVDLAEE